jgi:type I restriction enzyme S subunit
MYGPVMDMIPGFKRTDAGTIPDGWDARPLGGYVQFRTGPFGSALHKSDYANDGVPVINPMHIVNARLSPSVSMTVTESAARLLSDFRVKENDILIGRRGEMGRCAVVSNSQIGWVCGTGSMIIRCSAAMEPAFLQRVLSSQRAVAAIESASVGSTMINLNQGALSALIVQIPPPREQRAIAATLSDVDLLLDALNQLAAKKRHLKQAVMQQLLSGQSRLPGFSGKWDDVVLGETVLKIGSGVTPTGGSTVYTHSGRPFLRSQNIGWGKLTLDDVVYISDDIHGLFSGTEIQMGDVFLNITGASIGRSGVADLRVVGGNVNQHVCIIRPAPALLDSRYLNRFLLSEFGQRQIDSFQAGGNRQGLNLGQIRSFIVRRPSLAEQRAIASVLAVMDDELLAIELRRDKTMLFKQGMIQELLTGKTRLL